MIKVFNADDHPMLRKGVSNLIVQSPGLEWVGSAENGQDAKNKISKIKPDVAILDIEMPHLSGLEVAQQLISEGTSCEFILLTLFKDEAFFHHALKIGIKGYLLKESSEQEIVDCIKSVNSGRPYVNASLTQFLFSKPHAEDSVLRDLTEHEINIVKLIAQQKTSSEIAGMLFISPKTVTNHRTNISKKLGLSGEQNGLLKWAIQNSEILK